MVESVVEVAVEDDVLLEVEAVVVVVLGTGVSYMAVCVVEVAVEIEVPVEDEVLLDVEVVVDVVLGIGVS